MLQKNEDNLLQPSFIELLTTDSTNNYALNRLRAAQLTERQTRNLHGTVVFAHEQTGGKGQRGKKWRSIPGEGLQMTLIINPLQFSLSQQFLLSALVSVTARSFLAELTKKNMSIKWPNDLYFQDRKAGGILIENIISGTGWKWAVIGIGLNMNQQSFAPDLPNPVSLWQFTGKSYDILSVAKKMQTGFLEALHRFQPTEDSPKLLENFNRHLYKKGERVRLKVAERVFDAQIKEVTAQGQLLVNHENDELLNFGEVVWLG